jgi:hypothetical protein
MTSGFDFAYFCWYRLRYGPGTKPGGRWVDPPGSERRLYWAKIHMTIGQRFLIPIGGLKP